MHVDKPQSIWVTVLWTDETKVGLFGKSHIRKDKCKQNTMKLEDFSKHSGVKIYNVKSLVQSHVIIPSA